MIDGDTIEAISCVREASRCIHQGLAMLHYASGIKVGIKDVDDAQQLMLRAQQRLKQALAKIHTTQAGVMPATGEIQ